MAATISQMLFLSSRQSLTRISSLTQFRRNKISFPRYEADWEEKVLDNEEEVTIPKWRELKNQRKYKEWRPKKRLTRSEMEHLRYMHQVLPKENNIAQLAKKFNISGYSVVRILQSKFEPSQEVRERQDKRAMEQKDQRKINREQGQKAHDDDDDDDEEDDDETIGPYHKQKMRYSWTDLE